MTFINKLEIMSLQTEVTPKFLDNIIDLNPYFSTLMPSAFHVAAERLNNGM